MAHTLGGTTLYVTGDEDTSPAIVAELEVLDSTKTAVQHFSKPSPRRRLTAFIAGSTNMNAIKAMRSGSSSVAYVNDLGGQGNWFVKSVQAQRQSGRPSGFGGASPTDPIWVVVIDLIEDTA